MKNIQAYKTRWGGWGHSKRHQSRRKDARSLLQLTSLRLEITCFSTTVSSKRGHTLIHSNLSTCKDFLPYSYLVAILISYFILFLLVSMWNTLCPTFTLFTTFGNLFQTHSLAFIELLLMLYVASIKPIFLSHSIVTSKPSIYFSIICGEFRSFFSLNLIGFYD